MALKTQQYVRWLLGALLVTLLAAMTFNAVVDPFRVFGNESWVGVNHAKSDKNKRFSKAYIIARGDYDAVLLGSSRALRFNPEHPGFAGYHAYNAALDGGTVYETLRYLQHAHGAHPLRLAVVGLDYFSYSTANRVQSGFDESRLMIDAQGNPVPLYRRLQDYGNALLSVDAVKLSWRTFQRSRDDAKRPGNRLRGLNDRGFGEGNQGTLMKLGGHREASRVIEHYCLSKHGLWLGVGYEFYLRQDYGFLARRLRDFEATLRFAHQHGIALKLYISPIHTRLQVATRYVGVEPAWELWKRLLVAANEDVAREFGREPFPLWDFATVNTYTTEPIPRDPQAVMQWYEESSHFRTALADRVLDVVLATPAATGLLEEGFGTLLHSRGMDAFLAQQRDARDAWSVQHLDDVRDVVDQAREQKTLLPGLALPPGLEP